MSPGLSNDSFFLEQQRLASKKPHLRMRARIIQAVRLFFIGRGYLEVETPSLIPAPAPELHIDAFRAGAAFLHTSPELCMKRLLAAGYPKIFQVCRCFREAERGGAHLPEFTMLEWYQAGASYMGLMDECEEMIVDVSRSLGFGEKIRYGDREIDLGKPWSRVPLRDAFRQYASLSLEDALTSGRFDEVMVTEIEPRLGLPKPAFLFDYPVSLAALARVKKEGPLVAERFELYMAGLELANAFSELTDAHEQEARFLRDREKRRNLGKPDYPLPEKFLRALPHMPESAGIALGVDRLVMLFCDRKRIDDVVSFTPEEL
jgi:lysyl-tRNA synthetase class 2